MIVNAHKFRDRFASGQKQMFTGITIADPAVTEMLSDSTDGFWIDLEHNPTNLETMLAMLIAARAGGTPAFVRVPANDDGWIKRVLDSGAEGIICPQAEDAEAARRFVTACRYPPMGRRGFGPRRPTNYGRSGGQQFLDEANKNLVVLLQIETVGSLEQLDEIVQLEGLDGLVVGPNDLSGSLGYMGQVDHPDVLAAIERISTTAHAAGLSVGIGMGADAAQAQRAFELGVDWVQCGNDFEYMIRFADQLKEQLLG